MVDKQFILAGKAIFTIHNADGKHYTYKINSKPDRKDKTKKVYFVSLLTGPDNMSNYTYMGILNANLGEVYLTHASQYNLESLPFKVVSWGLKVIYTESHHSLPLNYGIKHEGRCGRCARRLTTPASIDSGIGPECIKKVGQ